VEELLSATATSEVGSGPSVIPGELTPTPTPTGTKVSSGTSPGDSGASESASQGETSGWSSLRLRWPSINFSAILIFIAVTSLFGALALLVALVLARRLGL
jgi:hypothetical protein